MEFFLNIIDHITRGSYNAQHQGAVKHLIKLSRILISTSDHQAKNGLVDSINDFLIYYNDRRHNTT